MERKGSQPSVTAEEHVAAPQHAEQWRPVGDYTSPDTSLAEKSARKQEPAGRKKRWLTETPTSPQKDTAREMIEKRQTAHNCMNARKMEMRNARRGLLRANQKLKLRSSEPSRQPYNRCRLNDNLWRQP